MKKEIEKPDKNMFLLIFIGFCVGIFAMSIGIGGSLMLLPILVHFLKYDLKIATALGLFFVIFSSIGGFISTSILLYTGFGILKNKMQLAKTSIPNFTVTALEYSANAK